jgi:sigma-B regulation protein RsbU (phosphoserine phosphatase)
VVRVWLAGLGGGLTLFLVLHGLFRGALRENLRLQEIERRLATVGIEMQAAGEIQGETMPSELPTVPGFRLAACHETSREVGGDYYDAFATPDGTIALIVADSEGKGMPGALVTAEAHEHVHVQAARLAGSAPVVAEVNRQLAGEASPERMVTAFFARLDAEERRLVYCSAGHCPTLLLRGGEVRALNAGGVPIGLTDAADYDEEAVNLEPGDVVLVYTDGVTEAATASGEQFGQDRLEAVLREAGPSADPGAVMAAVRDAVSDFTGGADPADDTTMLCLVATQGPAA